MNIIVCEICCYVYGCMLFCFKQKTAYEMRISDWSSDVCSSDLFYFRTTDVTGVVHLPEGTEMVMPGDNVSMTVELIAPIAMDEGLRFAIREGDRKSVV